MPLGKPAGVRCVQLDAGNRCLLFGLPQRPAVCVGLKPADEMCGADAAQAIAWLMRLERATVATSGRRRRPRASLLTQLPRLHPV